MTINNKNKKVDLIKKPYFGHFVFFCFMAMELTGLFVQYVMGIPPCGNCVITRAFITMIGLSGILIILANKTNKPLFYHFGYFACITGAGGAFFYNNQNHLIETGKMISTCSTGSPFPDYLPLDTWMPFIFSPEGLCGTPVYLWSDVTLTEITSIGLVSAMVISTLIYFSYAVNERKESLKKSK